MGNRRQVEAGKRRIHRHIRYIVINRRHGRHHRISLLVRLKGHDVKEISVLAGIDEIRPHPRHLLGGKHLLAAVELEAALIKADDFAGIVVYLCKSVYQIVFTGRQNIARGLHNHAFGVRKASRGAKQHGRKHKKHQNFLHGVILPF